MAMAALKLVSITTVAVIFVLLQYLTAPQSSVFSHLNINEGNEWNIPSLHAVLVCLSRLFHDVLERQEKRLGRVSFERVNAKTFNLQLEE